MKESEIEWIGEIPKEWQISKIGSHFNERTDKVSDLDYEPLSVTKGGIVPQLATAAKSSNHNNRKLVLKDDFVINSRSDRKMSSGISYQNGSVSVINTVIYSYTISKEYSKYLLKNYSFAEEFYRWGSGIVADLWSTRWDKMKNISIPVPKITEQENIAKELDEISEKIDNITRETQQSIGELKKYKQSVITEAVTKGLDPNVEMKDSEFPFFGFIPKTWRVSSLGRMYDVTLGKMLSSSQRSSDWTLERYLSAANIGFSGISENPIKEMWFSPRDKTIYKVNKSDLLIVEGGAGAGGSAIVESLSQDTYIQNSVLIARTKGYLTNKYLYYILHSLIKNGYIQYLGNVATFSHYTREKVSNTHITIPSQLEQNEIVEYLDNKVEVIDTLIDDKEKVIEELEQYRRSLIYEYVTGKKEV